MEITISALHYIILLIFNNIVIIIVLGVTGMYVIGGREKLHNAT